MAELTELIDLGLVLNYIGKTEADDDSNKVMQILLAVTWAMSQYTHRTLRHASHTEYYDGDGTDKLFLNNYPITSTASTISLWVNADTPRAYGDGDKISSDNIIIKESDGLIVLDGDVFTKGAKTVKITYDAGYANLPYNIQMAALKWCAKLWREQANKLDGDISNVSIQGAAITLNIDKIIPGFVEEALRYEVRPING